MTRKFLLLLWFFFIYSEPVFSAEGQLSKQNINEKYKKSEKSNAIVFAISLFCINDIVNPPVFINVSNSSDNSHTIEIYKIGRITKIDDRDLLAKVLVKNNG